MTERVNAFLNASRRAALERATRRTRVLAAIALGAALLIAIVAGALLYAATKARALQEAETQLAKSQLAEDAGGGRTSEGDGSGRGAAEDRGVGGRARAGTLCRDRACRPSAAATLPPPSTPSKVTPTESLQADIALKSLPPPMPTVFEPAAGSGHHVLHARSRQQQGGRASWRSSASSSPCNRAAVRRARRTACGMARRSRRTK